MNTNPSNNQTLLRLALLTFLCPFSFQACDDANEMVEAEIELEFAITVGDIPFVCGQMNENLGATETEYAFTDMRMFVHDVVLVSTDGQEYPVQIDDDGIWQRDGIVLLDFENGCENGTSQMNTKVVGRVANTNTNSIRFSVGIPPEVNSNETVLEGRGSPLNQTAMFWSWMSGYKYIRLDGAAGPFRFHLGATGCDSAFQCDEVNIPTIQIDGFEPREHQIRLDLGHLLAETDISTNSPGTAPGCMGESIDPDCTSIFERLGLGNTTEDLSWSAQLKATSRQ